MNQETVHYGTAINNNSKGPFIATQLKLSTRSQREQQSPISSERRDPVRVSIATQLNSTQLDVELSCVAINGP